MREVLINITKICCVVLFCFCIVLFSAVREFHSETIYR